MPSCNVLDQYASSRWAGTPDVIAVGGSLNVEIVDHSHETVKDQRTNADVPKLCLRLKGLAKPLLLNKTNVKTLAKALGTDPADWTGATATLLVVPTSMGDGLRFSAVKPKSAPLKAGAADKALNDEIGF